MKKLVNFILTMPILYSRLILLAIGIIFILLWFLVLHGFYGDNFPPNLRDLGLGLGSIIVGFSGLIQVVKRERPGITVDKPVRGTAALIEGYFGLALFWLAGLVLLIGAIFE